MKILSDSPSVSALTGVGPVLTEELQQIGVRTLDDLFSYFPFRYDNYEVRDLAEVRDGEHVTVAGKVHSEPILRFYVKKRSRLTVRVLSGRYLISVIVFNRSYLKKKLVLGSTVTVTGKWEKARAALTATEFHLGSPKRETIIAPVYSVKGNLTVKRMRKLIEQAFRQFPEAIHEILPDPFVKAYRLINRQEAVHEIHFPKDRAKLFQARRRLVYEELLQYELKMQAFKQVKRQAAHGHQLEYSKKKLTEFIQKLPFPLTGAQKRVVSEILNDLSSGYSMNRLLQGDVGSGKTVVAAIALYAAVTADAQGALMAPTEILAQQHAESLAKLLAPFSVEVALLTGGVRGKKRRRLLTELKEGSIQILVGTHALIQEDVVFRRLGLVVTDEQHRFGVAQRRSLRVKGEDPDVLYMTATPIPRTLALSVYGDMDVSTIDELPGGRKMIQTYWVTHQMMDRVIGFIKKELQKGRQAYVICPLIEESEQLDVQNALDVHTELSKSLPEFTVGLMHGRLAPEEKEEVMEQFKENRLQLLVSTTVVEVGVNVPNATLMVIYDADRFGLAQLHQLRGRVGRGSNQSYCVLLANARSDIAKEKMKLMTETTDGFKLSAYDLKLRGPGDFFGKNQSGMPDFKLADIIHDYRTLAAARSDAAKLVRDQKFWTDDTYKKLREPLIEAGVLAKQRLD